MVTITRCIKDEQINVVAMTEGFPWKGGLFHQTILCKQGKQVPVGTYCILVPKLYAKSEFQMSEMGRTFQEELTFKYGPDLARFRNVYLARVVKSVGSLSNDLTLWSDICRELFPLWDPTGPRKHVHEHESSIILFRVYRTVETVDALVRKPLKLRSARQPTIASSHGVAIPISTPAIDDVEFQRQEKLLEDILRRHP